MSTKIYDAYLYKGTVHALMRFLSEMRQEKIDRFIKETAELIAPNDFDFGGFMAGLRKDLSSGERVMEIAKGIYTSNPACSAVVYPTRVGHKNAVLVQFFGIEDRSLDKLPRRLFRDFHYQDQTDTPIGPREWARRKATWARIFKHSSTPAQVGLSYDLIGPGDATDLALRVFKKLHGHEIMADASAQCKVCQYRRELAAKKEKPE
jgi:hypothetical protein